MVSDQRGEGGRGISKFDCMLEDFRVINKFITELMYSIARADKGRARLKLTEERQVFYPCVD